MAILLNTRRSGSRNWRIELPATGETAAPRKKRGADMKMAEPLLCLPSAEKAWPKRLHLDRRGGEKLRRPPRLGRLLKGVADRQQLWFAPRPAEKRNAHRQAKDVTSRNCEGRI